MEPKSKAAISKAAFRKGAVNKAASKAVRVRPPMVKAKPSKSALRLGAQAKSKAKPKESDALRLGANVKAKPSEPDALRLGAKAIVKAKPSASDMRIGAKVSAPLSEDSSGTAISKSAILGTSKAGATARRFYASSKYASSKQASPGAVRKSVGIVQQPAAAAATEDAPGAVGKATQAPVPPWRQEHPLPPPPRPKAPPKAAVPPPPPPLPPPPVAPRDAATTPAVPTPTTPVLPPWRRQPQDQVAAVSAAPGRQQADEAESDDEDDDYDPFAEEPAPSIDTDKGGQVPGGLEVLAELKDLVKQAQEESRQSIASIRVVTSHLTGTSPSKTDLRQDGAVPKATSAADPAGLVDQAKQPESGPPEQVPPVIQPVAQRMRAGARLAQEYFVQAGAKETGKSEPPAKRQRIDAAPRFATELLNKAPKEVQTCRSLLLFLNKKLEAGPAKEPIMAGAVLLKKRLELFAEATGRIASLREQQGWDARAKRVLDIASYASSPAGVDALTNAEKGIEGEQAKLLTELKDENGGLEAVIKERRQWAKDLLRREWLSWCARLLQAREKMLLEKVEQSSPGAPAQPDGVEEASALDTAAIFKLLLAGKAGFQAPSRAGS